MSQPHNYLQSVRDQYEDYPYPKRDPLDEKTRFVTTYIDPLDIINYYCFAGKQDFANHFRVLVAGGGTGDSAIYLAEQLRHTNAEIVYVDISTASMAIARERAEIRELRNITWIHHSLLEIGNLGLGKFDYINCSGVLHHLADPTAGLQALKNVLKDDGAMGIMVYGQYGRTGIYHMQALMKILCQHTSHPQEKVDLCKEVLQQLPQDNYFAQDIKQISDICDSGDIGIYDLFLHSQDRAYTVPELYEWVENCQLHIADIIAERGLGKSAYGRHYLTQTPDLDKKVSSYTPRDQQAIAELICGNLFKHTCFVASRFLKKPQPDDLDNIPAFFTAIVVPHIYEKLTEALTAQNPDAQNGKLLLHYREDNVALTANAYTLDLFRFIDGHRTIGDIIDCVIAAGIVGDNTQSRAELLRQFIQLFREFNLLDWMLLRHKSVPLFKNIEELQAAVKQRGSYAQTGA